MASRSWGKDRASPTKVIIATSTLDQVSAAQKSFAASAALHGPVMVVAALSRCMT